MVSSFQVRLVEKLIEDRVIYTPKVIETLRNIDRGCFLSSSESSYEDSPMQIGYNATISAPHMHGYALEYLKNHLIPGGSALDIGSGSGYFTLCMAHYMDYQGRVIGVEHIHELVKISLRSIEKCRPQSLSQQIVQIFEGDGRYGNAEFAPYKAIHVGAASETVPQALIDQLDFGGRMVIPIGKIGKNQKIVIIDKSHNGTLTTTEEFSVRYVPLTDKEVQCPRF